ncbi:hypothetical protein [Allochromatium humboldtianum]|uniref:hypothetical protein n=1 Tax=Allochromatium humboldtianum TaxID=504901 RepID=UPI001CA43556|nr:hypothetical protein [Allochromatium humboldtianum]
MADLTKDQLRRLADVIDVEVILDTHTLLWMDRDDPALGSNARRQIQVAWRAGSAAVSAISFWSHRP